MAFTGDLQYLPIVDVIQLLHATRKSGILRVRGRKGESELIFRDGFIVSASHLNNSVRIGEVLIERHAIDGETLQRALEEQSRAGSRRRPLIATLLDLGLVNEKEAYAGLQALIEMTLVEIFTWKSGSFVLDALEETAADGYQYPPPALEREISVDTQGVLMDSLRIFDEKVRDGQLSLEDDTEQEAELTADDLGLADLDQLERRIPGVFVSIEDRLTEKPEAATEPEVNPVRQLNEILAALPHLSSAPQVAQAQLQYVGQFFERALTLVVRQGEAIAEKGIGIRTPRIAGAIPVAGLRIPLEASAFLRDIVARGTPYLGTRYDESFEGQFLQRIDAPAGAKILLLPVKRAGRTLFLTYADFGDGPEKDVSVELLSMLAAQAGETLNALALKRQAEKG